MDIRLPGWAYKQITDKDGRTHDRVYETFFEIDVNSIESITPSTGPLSAPDDLPYSRIIGKSGRFYDINLPSPELRSRIKKAMQQMDYQEFIKNSN
jgi:hypothetical protein